jgi:hypothetical protein
MQEEQGEGGEPTDERIDVEQVPDAAGVAEIRVDRYTTDDVAEDETPEHRGDDQPYLVAIPYRADSGDERPTLILVSAEH